MSLPHSTDSPVHLLSRKSRRLLRNTFFFLPGLSGRLLGGELILNCTFCRVYLTSFTGLNQRLTPVTSAKLQRWVRILDPRALKFELQPITIKKTIAILTYEKVPVGPSIPADSTVPLAPGDYAWYVTGRPHLFIWPHHHPWYRSVTAIRYRFLYKTVPRFYGGVNLRRVEVRGRATRTTGTSSRVSTLGMPFLNLHNHIYNVPLSMISRAH